MRISGPPLPPLPVGGLTEAIEAIGYRRQPWLTVVRGREEQAFSGAELHALAARWQAAIEGAGLEPGERAVVLFPNDERWVAAFLGLLRAGGVAVPLAFPASLSDPAEAMRRLQPLLTAADPRLVLTTPELAPFVALPSVTQPASSPATGAAPVRGEDPAFIQFTSGSLGQPRGAVISHRAALSCTFSMGLAMALGPVDRGISWLPLYHDMGLVGALLCPLFFGFPLDLMRPGDFLLHPSRFLSRAAHIGATVAAAPDFGWKACARRARLPPGDLSRWRVALNGAEPVHRSTIEEFQAAFGPHGFRESAMRPSYGLAENTLGVALYEPRDPAPDLQHEGRLLPSVGSPLPGVEVEVDPQGEIRVRSASLMSGYFRDPEASAAALDDGWLRTGDLGQIHQGQLYISGRIKDLVIHNGVKFHPYDIERVAAEAAGSPPNGAVALARPGPEAEELVVVVEVSGRNSEGVDRRVRGALVDQLGLRPDQVLTVAPGALPRTTSGKVRRPAARALFGGQHA